MEELTKEEIEFYKDTKNQKALINYGVLVTTSQEDEKKIIFRYPIFPKLTNFGSIFAFEKSEDAPYPDGLHPTKRQAYISTYIKQ